jgi:hypothetical protein
VKNVLARRNQASALATVAVNVRLGRLINQGFAGSEEVVLDLIPTLLLTRHG